VAPPPNIPAITADWARLVDQIPVSVSGVLLASFDDVLLTDLDRGLASMGQVIDAAALTDALGVSLLADGALDALGFRARGAFAVFLYQDSFVALLDVGDPAPLRALLEALPDRNPDLPMRWREVAGLEVLTVAVPGEQGPTERLHVMLADGQLRVLYDSATTPAVWVADELLETLDERDLSENLLYNHRFVESLEAFGGDSWALFFLELPRLFAIYPRIFGESALPWAMGDPPAQPRCEQVETRLGEVVPYVLGSIQRDVQPTDNGPVERESQTLLFRIAATERAVAEQLLRPTSVDVQALERTAIMSGFLSVNLATLMDQFGDVADAASCPNFAVFPGLLGSTVGLLADYPELQEDLDGELAGALFDVRNSGGVPFMDVFVLIGSPTSAALAGLFGDALESQLGAYGTPELVAGVQAVRYRVALLYQLTLFEGERGLGVGLGRVDDSWAERLLSTDSPGKNAFVGFFLDGPRLADLYQTVSDILLMGAEDDAEMTAIQREMTESAIEEFRHLLLQRISGYYEDGFVRFDIDRERLLTP
jgi:hypothetical protein